MPRITDSPDFLRITISNRLRCRPLSSGPACAITAETPGKISSTLLLNTSPKVKPEISSAARLKERM